MNILDIRAQLEDDLTWRENEIRFFRNQLANIADDNGKKLYRKALIVMLYSHYEGFCKTAFLIYVKAINNEIIKRGNATPYIVAASLAEVFKAYENTDKKCEYFKHALPEDEKIHRFARQVDFVKDFNDIWNVIVDIPETIVDTESNLKPVVLRKILYRLGFAYDLFDKHEGQINHLLARRNNIAHGIEKAGLDEKVYLDIEKATLNIMNELIKKIIEALISKAFLKTATA